MITNVEARYLICPATGDIPFTVTTREEAVDFIVTEDYYAVDLATGLLVWNDDAMCDTPIDHRE